MKVMTREVGLFVAFENLNEIDTFIQSLYANFSKLKEDSENAKFPFIFAMLNRDVKKEEVDPLMYGVYEEYFKLSNPPTTQDDIGDNNTNVESSPDTRKTEEGSRS